MSKRALLFLALFFEPLYSNVVKQTNSDNEDDGVDDETGNDTEEENSMKILLEGNAKLVFAHPEAVISSRKGRKVLLSEVFQQRVVACVIDQGHLIDEWGFEFRPDFGKLSQLGSIFPTAPLLILTATAPKHIRVKLVKSLLLYKPVFVLANLDRPNIYIRKEKRISSSGSDSYDAILLPIARDLKNRLREYPLTLIYMPLKWCGYAFKLFMDEIGEKSYFPESEKTPQNCLFAQFHAPQTERMKHEIMKQLTGKNEDRVVRIVFATIAIRIGVNIHDIRRVIHLGVPRTIESYYQEISRAGRDGKPADATLYFNGHDIATNKPGMTQAMRAFCMEEISCLRNEIMIYLGSPSSGVNLRNHTCCSNCSKCCQCSSCTKSKEFPQTSCNDNNEDAAELMPVRNVSDGQRKKIRDMLIEYRCKLGSTGNNFGGIDLTTGVTLDLIDSIVSRCHTIKSAEHLFAEFEIWDMEYAHVIFKCIGNVCAS